MSRFYNRSLRESKTAPRREFEPHGDPDGESPRAPASPHLLSSLWMPLLPRGAPWVEGGPQSELVSRLPGLPPCLNLHAPSAPALQDGLLFVITVRGSSPPFSRPLSRGAAGPTKYCHPRAGTAALVLSSE